MNLQNKVVCITGATGGIGSLIAEKAAHEGCRLILLGRNKEKLEALSKSLHAKTYSCDLTDPASRADTIKKILSNYPHIDILVNAAGIGIYKKMSDITNEDWYSSYELNVHTPFILARDLEASRIVNIGSCSALQHKASRAIYNSTKAALRSLTLCLDQETPHRFIHITLDSTLTSFGSLTLEDKKKLQKEGKQYLDPTWVSNEVLNILKKDTYDPEYVLSPDCYENCGTWEKP